MAEQTEIIIVVPGGWPTRANALRAIAETGDGLIFAGNILLDTRAGEGLSAELLPRDKELGLAFELAGGALHRRRRPRGHPSPHLRAGGVRPRRLAGADAAHAGDRLRAAAGWRRRRQGRDGRQGPQRPPLARAGGRRQRRRPLAFVTLVGEGGGYYSCGMHNLGQRDAQIRADSPAGAAATLQSFLLYTLLERPTLRDGHTFSERADAPRYRLHGAACADFPADHPFFNPYGVWRLEPAGEEGGGQTQSSPDA